MAGVEANDDLDELLEDDQGSEDDSFRFFARKDGEIKTVSTSSEESKDQVEVNQDNQGEVEEDPDDSVKIIGEQGNFDNFDNGAPDVQK